MLQNKKTKINNLLQDFTPIPNTLLQDMRLDPIDVLIFAKYIRIYFDNYALEPEVKDLSQKIHIEFEVVQKSINKLRSYKYL